MQMCLSGTQTLTHARIDTVRNLWAERERPSPTPYKIVTVQAQLLTLMTYEAKLLNADWLRKKAFFFYHMQGKITEC